jgi:hypothetical protein
VTAQTARHESTPLPGKDIHPSFGKNIVRVQRGDGRACGWPDRRPYVFSQKFVSPVTRRTPVE